MDKKIIQEIHCENDINLVIFDDKTYTYRLANGNLLDVTFLDATPLPFKNGFGGGMVRLKNGNFENMFISLNGKHILGDSNTAVELKLLYNTPRNFLGFDTNTFKDENYIQFCLDVIQAKIANEVSNAKDNPTTSELIVTVSEQMIRRIDEKYREEKEKIAQSTKPNNPKDFLNNLNQKFSQIGK